MLAIYNPEIEAGTATFEMSPRSLEEQLDWIAEHSGAHPAVVAVTTGDDGEERRRRVRFPIAIPATGCLQHDGRKFGLRGGGVLSDWASGGQSWKNCSAWPRPTASTPSSPGSAERTTPPWPCTRRAGSR